MSINNGDDAVQATSESFWEVGKFMRTVNRIDNGYKLLSNLKQLITQRAEIERAYAKQLTAWSKKWNEFLDKGPEYGTTQGAWRGVLEESDQLSDLHNEVGDKLVNSVTVSIKQWQKDNYHKSMMHFKESKEMEDQFRKVQRPWEKKLNKVMQAKKDYHNACRTEKSTANQENNARADSAMSSDQLKKLQEKLKKCQTDVDNTNQKYQASLNDLNGYNAKYMEEMTDVFNKCQSSEKKRIEFVKKIMFDIHQCLDLSVDTRYSQVYTDLHHTISNTDADKDLLWWSHHHGKEMPMAWPMFEEYSPDLKPINSNQKKSSQITTSGQDGITITSIKHNTDNFVQQPTQSSNNRGSTGSQQSRSSNQFNNSSVVPAPSTMNNDHTTSAPIQDHTPVTNPFGDGDSDDLDEQVSESGSVPRSTGESNLLSTPARVLYAYKAEEEDEISADAGDVITRLSDQDDMGWVKAIAKNGREGLIPYSYIEDI